ncbi:phosphatidic acid phosphatase type 2/haloperoxidase, partial [Clohesyomyces aquaticus]
MTKKAKKEKQKRDYFLFKDSPPFIFWLKESWNDLLFFALSGAVALVIYTALDPLGPRYFPLTYVGQVIFPQLAYPYMKEYVPTWLSAVVSNLVPFAFIGLISIFWIGDFWDCDSAIMGQSYAMSAATLFQSLLKYLIGGFRPHFLEVCDPHPGIPEGYQNIYYDTSICRGNSKHIKEAMASFPSGHATAAFAGFIFLALWINAKFKVFADYQTRYWQTLLFTCPIAIACLIAASKTIDYWHHWSDIIAGAIIGTFFAFWGYRQVYRSVFDWRYNHEPLPRH